MRLSHHLMALGIVTCLSFAAPARAAPGSDDGEDAIEDRLADGDLDEEDRAPLRFDRRSAPSDVHGASWISIAGFDRELLSGRRDIGGLVVVGLALDRAAAGAVHRIDGTSAAPAAAWSKLGDPASAAPPDGTSAAPAAAWSEHNATSAEQARITAPQLARSCVAAAWRTAGLGADDARIDELMSRSRESALLPETRVRAMRLWDDASHATTLATTYDTSYYDAIGANLVLEVRLTWRLDRLLYAGDEPTLERVRLERQDARARVAARTLEALFAWQRATLAADSAAAAAPEKAEAELRAAEAAATLDVLTGGWFSTRSAPPPPP